MIIYSDIKNIDRTNELSQEDRIKCNSLKQKIYETNNKIGNLEGYNCELCNNRGYYDVIDFDDYYNIPTIEQITCECMTIRKENDDLNKSDLGIYSNSCLNDFKTNHQWQYGLKKMATEYINDKQDKWLIIEGGCGVGKTLICSIIVNSFIKQERKVKCISWIDYIQTNNKNTMSNEFLDKAIKEKEKVKKSKILFIDDFNFEVKYFKYTNHIEEIINYRYSNNLKTIIATQNTFEDIQKISETVYSKIISKSKGYYFAVPRNDKFNFHLYGQ